MTEFEQLASGYTLIEGPRVDASGRLHFSDVHKGGVYRLEADGSVSTVIPKRRGVGGMLFHANGGLVVSGRNLQHVKNGEIRVLFEGDEAIGGFNDVHADQAGNVYCGSLRTSPFGRETKRQAGECYRIGVDGQTRQIYDNISLTNGIGFSPDYRAIYHADTRRGHIVAHDIDSAGNCTNRRAHVTLQRGAPDGLTVDESGGLWIACVGAGCVAHYDAKAKLVEYFEVPHPAVTSLCFGGPDGCDLYVVTAGDKTSGDVSDGAVFRARVDIAGLPTPLARV